MKYNIMGIVLENRNNEAPRVQEILTRFGCIINLRVGFHKNVEKTCTNNGLIILELSDEKEEINKLKETLNKISGVTAETISL